MRILCVFCVWLIGLSVAGQEASSLQKQVQTIAAQHHGKVALYAENLQTHHSVAMNADEPVQTASVIKLAILYEALEQVKTGRTSFGARIIMSKDEPVGGSGVLHLLDTPLTLTLKDALTLMIVMSDNTATNLVIDHLGLASINARIASLGLKDTYLYKKVFTPNAPGVVMPADQKRFGLGKTTAREMAKLMTRISLCELGKDQTPDPADRPLCATAQQMLHTQFYRNGIPRYLDTMIGATDDSIANKTGALDAVRNDVAMVSTKDGMVVMSIFTYDNADKTWTADDEGDMTIAKLARAIVQAWSPQGLAPWPTAK